MKRKLVIAVIIVLFVLTCAALVAELTRKDEPPELVFPTAEAVSEEISSEESSTPPTAETSAVASESSQETAESAETQDAVSTLYTSHDPLHGFSVTFDGNRILVSGVYEGDRVTRISLSGGGSARAQYEGEQMSAEIAAESSEGTEKLLIHFDTGWSLPVFIACDENGLPSALSTEAGKRSELALAHPITIPKAAVTEYIMTGGTADERAEVLAQVQDISDRVCEGLLTDYDKARALSAWVARNIYYDYVAFESEVTVKTLSLANTLELKRTVCGGYANLYAALCQAQGISCHVVKGTVIQGGGTFADGGHEAPSHEWNVIQLDGRHVWVDNLWNTSNGYDGEYYLGDQTYRYFDISDECMAINHRAERVEIREFF